MRKKLRSAGGLTLVEMLCAVAILVLLCLMMNTGMQMAVKSYDRLTAESETKLLLGSLSDALIDKLRYAVVTDTDTLSIGEVRLENGRIVVVEKKRNGQAAFARRRLWNRQMGVRRGARRKGGRL